MKKKVYYLMLMALMTGFTACSNSDENDAEMISRADQEASDAPAALAPIEEGADVAALTAFFGAEFGVYDETTKPFDLKNNLSDEKNPCVVINSMEAFGEAYTGDLTLPDIDFSKYTLVFGNAFLDAGTFIDNMKIRLVDGDKVALVINCIMDSKGCYIATMCQKYYWALFPKFSASEVKVEVSAVIGEIDDSKK